MASLDIAKIVQQSLNTSNSIQESYNDYDNNLSNFSLCNIQEFGLGPAKEYLGKGVDIANNTVRKLGGKITSSMTNDHGVGDHITRNAGRYTAGILGGGAAGGIVGSGAATSSFNAINNSDAMNYTKDKLSKAYNDINNSDSVNYTKDKLSKVYNDINNSDSIKHIKDLNGNVIKNPLNRDESGFKGVASDIADHVKEHAGKYALGGTALAGLTAGGLAARKYMNSRKK